MGLLPEVFALGIDFKLLTQAAVVSQTTHSGFLYGLTPIKYTEKAT